MSEKPTSDKLHPAQAISNIKTHVPVTLDLEQGNYISWSEVFQTHCCATDVLDHIVTTTESSSSAAAKTPEDQKLWSRLDAIVKQWMYATITPDLMETILVKNSTAKQAWDRLESIFQDNKTTRALYLRNRFSTTKLDSFSNITSYCQELKNISDQLANVDSPVPNEQLVLQVLAGLNETYDGVGMFIQQMKPLPDFYEVRSKLILEETRKKNQNPTPPMAFIHSTSSLNSQNHHTNQHNPSRNPIQPAAQHPSSQTHPQYHHNNDPRYPFHFTNRGRGRGGRYRGRGRSRQGGRRDGFSHPFSYNSYNPTPQYSYNWQQPNLFQQPSPPPWPTPPVPYPTAAPVGRGPTKNSNNMPGSAGILGPAPAQAFSAQDYYNPTNVEHALNSLNLNPDQNWYLDTGATNHMTHSTGLPDADTFPPM